MIPLHQLACRATGAPAGTCSQQWRNQAAEVRLHGIVQMSTGHGRIHMDAPAGTPHSHHPLPKVGAPESGRHPPSSAQAVLAVVVSHGTPLHGVRWCRVGLPGSSLQHEPFEQHKRMASSGQGVPAQGAGRATKHPRVQDVLVGVHGIAIVHVAYCSWTTHVALSR